MKYLPIIFAILISILLGCSSPEEKAKKEVYDLGVKVITERLKVPSTAKFQPFGEITKDKIRFSKGDKIFKYSELNPSSTYTEELKKKMDDNFGDIRVDVIIIELYVEAQNIFGVFIKSTWTIAASRQVYAKGEPNIWALVDVFENKD